jgi:hypothetical protein
MNIVATQRCIRVSIGPIRTTKPDIKSSLEQYVCDRSAKCASPDNRGSVGREIPRKDNPIKKYTSFVVENVSFSPHTMKHCKSILDIDITNSNRYFCAHSSEQSKKFSNPRVAKGPCTLGSSSLTTSLSHTQSLSL